MLHNKINTCGGLVIFFVVFFINSVGHCYVSDSIKAGYNWTSSSSNNHCKSHGIDDACVGNSAVSGGVCTGWGNRGTYSDERATLLFIAHQVNANGAKFCLTQVQGANKNKNKGVAGPWLTYYAAAGNQTKCFWLCKAGYGGPECNDPVADGAVCNAEEISRNAFSGYKLATSSTMNLESTDWMFGRWQNPGTKCNAHGENEHEAFLAVSGWLPSGHGAKVAPMMAWADRSGWDDMESAPIIHRVGDQLLMCSPGYKPNPSNTDCEVVNATTCMLQNGTFCDGFSRDKFDETIHTIDSTSAGKCLRYFCKDSNKAFPSSGDTSCEDCAVGVRGGPNPNNGVCVLCDLGQYFDSTSGQCKSALGFSRTDLQYGVGKTNSKSGKVSDQCWTKTTPEEYANCVKGITTSTSIDSSNLVQKYNFNTLKLKPTDVQTTSKTKLAPKL
ncbi:MAG: hypothetical protein KBT14_02925 [Proteobacteria bacterium]|nr:hypothetical protein [Candidatus Enterousia onthequi]